MLIWLKKVKNYKFKKKKKTFESMYETEKY